MLLQNVPIRLVASLHNTSVAMIERTYSKYITEHSDDISRKALLQLPAGDPSRHSRHRQDCENLFSGRLAQRTGTPVPNPRVSFQFTDEQWEAIRSVRKSWPDDIDWVQVRGIMELLGRMYLLGRVLRSHLGSPVKIRDSLRTALRLIRKLQAAMNALPVRHSRK